MKTPGVKRPRQPRRQKIVANLKTWLDQAAPDREIIAVIAYLQRLGTDIKAAPVADDQRSRLAGSPAPIAN